MREEAEGFAKNADRPRLILTRRSPLRRELAVIAREAEAGYLFDDRFALHFHRPSTPDGADANDTLTSRLGEARLRRASRSRSAAPAISGTSNAQNLSVGPGGVLA
jgi:hypothetical protein